MYLSRLMLKWLHLPSRIALLLSIGALSATGARADTPVSHDNGSAFDDVRVRLEGRNVYVSERDGAFRQLGDSTETRLLIQLLEGSGATFVAQPLSTKLAGSGGAGFHWAPADKADTSGKPSSTAQSSAHKAIGTTAPQQHENATPKATPGSTARKE